MDTIRKRPPAPKKPRRLQATVLPFPSAKIVKVDSRANNREEMYERNRTIIASWKLGCAVLNQLADRL